MRRISALLIDHLNLINDFLKMGNTSKKLAAKCTLLTKEEQKHVAATFRAASKNSDKIREDDLIVSAQVDADSLERYWGPQIDPRLTQYLTKFLFGSSITSSQPASFNRFAELYVYNVRGTADEKLTLTYNCLGSQYNSSSDLPYQLLKEYCEAIVSTYIKILKASSSPQAKAWIGKGFRGKAAHVQALAEAAASGAGAQPDTPPTACDSRTLRQWLMTDTLFAHMTEMVYSALYGITREQHYDGSAEQVAAVPPLLPMVEGLGAMPDYPAFIDLAHIVWLNSHLPVKHQGKWRFLFSSHIHGESFATLAGRIQDQGASVLIIEDSNGYIFGGYATDSWQFNSTFYGGEESFLFTLAPRIRCYPATGFNNHYQYINNHTKTLPNGLLMGGQFDFGGIWINADPFGQGSSAESCSTYRGYKRLSKEQTFRIRSLEVWGVGEKPLTAKESLTSVSSRGSVLDSHKAEQKFLAMTGRHSVSEGLRC